jgi:long-chain acyl-CoA synthetase
VPLDRDWLANDLAETVAKAECEVLICDTDIAEKAEAICERTGIKDVFYLAAEGEGSVGELVSLGKEKFRESSDAYFNTEIDADKMSILVFTSGTTGKGKGVMLTQTGVLSDMSDVIPFIDFSKKSVSVLPPHHTFGSSVMIVGHCMIGCEIYISAGLKYITKELKAEKPGHLILVPLYLETFYRKILANIKAKNSEKKFNKGVKISNFLRKISFGLIDLRKKLFKEVRDAFGGELSMVISGGAALNSEIVEFFENIGISTLNGYGITECSPIISVNHSQKNIKGSVGFPL